MDGNGGPGVGGETGSGEDASGDRVMDTSDNGTGGGYSGVAQLESINDLPIGFPINNIISHRPYQGHWQQRL